MRASLLAVVLIGCASGGKTDATVDSGGTGSGTVDGSNVVIDGSTGDGPTGPQTRTLTQTTSQTLTPLKAIACPGANSGTAANNYYRVFDLAAMGITTPFTVTQVSFQIEHCDQLTGTTGATVAVRVGTYAGTPGTTLNLADMTILNSNPTVAVPEVIETQGPPPSTPGGTVNAPITATIPAGQKLLVEVDAPDGNNQYAFYMGANALGESAPAYILAPRCLLTVPTNINTVATDPDNNNAPITVHLLLTVTGQY